MVGEIDRCVSLCFAEYLRGICGKTVNTHYHKQPMTDQPCMCIVAQPKQIAGSYPRYVSLLGISCEPKKDTMKNNKKRRSLGCCCHHVPLPEDQYNHTAYCSSQLSPDRSPPAISLWLMSCFNKGSRWSSSSSAVSSNQLSIGIPLSI